MKNTSHVLWLLFRGLVIGLLLYGVGTLIGLKLVQAGGRGRATPSPTPSVSMSPSPKPTLSPDPPHVFVTLGTDIGLSVNLKFAHDALDLMNQAYTNGCLRGGIQAHHYTSLNTVFDLSPQTATQAADEYLGGAPYALDLKWYSPWPAGNVIGYTYNFKGDDWNGKSETRIWTNVKKWGLYNPRNYAAHLAHELSHQARAGGFVHYTVFGGSFPYDTGDVMGRCVGADL